MNKMLNKFSPLLFILFMVIYIECSNIAIFIEISEDKTNIDIFPNEIVLPSHPNITLSVSKQILNSKNLCESTEEIKSDRNSGRILNIFLGEFGNLDCLDSLLEREKAFAFMINTKNDTICYRNIIFGYNFTDPAIKSIDFFQFIFQIGVGGIMNYESKYLILYDEDQKNNFDEEYNRIVTFHSRHYTTLYLSSETSSIDLSEMLYSNTTVISFVRSSAFKNLENVNVKLFLLGYCSPSYLFKFNNSNIYCIEPSIDLDDVLPNNITELIINYIGEKYIYDYIYQAMFTMIVKMFHLSRRYSNSLIYQYQFQVLRRLYDPPAPIYSTLLAHNVSTFHVVSNNNENNENSYKLEKYQHFPCGIWPTMYLTGAMSQLHHCSSPGHFVKYNFVPIVMLFYHEVVLSMEGTIDAIKCINNNGGINKSPIQIYPIEFDYYENNQTALIRYLDELYQSIKYHIVIFNSYYKDYSFLFRYFQNHEIFFLSLSQSNNDTYYNNVGYMHMDINSLLHKSRFDHLFNNPYLVGDYSDFSETESGKFLLFYKTIFGSSFAVDRYNESALTVEEITREIVEKMEGHDVIICTFDSILTKNFLQELTEKYNTNGIIKYHVFVTSLSQYTSTELDYTGHYFYGVNFNYSNDTPYDISDLDSFDLQYLNFFDRNTLYSENYMTSFFSVFYILKALSLSGIPDKVSYLVRTMITTHLYSHIGPFIFTANHYFSVLTHLLYYTSPTEYKEILSSNGIITKFNSLSRYQDYYCNYDIDIDYQTIVLFADYPKFSFFYDMLLVLVSYYNMYHVQESNVTMNYWSITAIQPPYDREQVMEHLADIENDNEIIFAIVTADVDENVFSDYMKENSIPVFSTALTKGGSCVENIINVGEIPALYFQSGYSILRKRYGKIVIVLNPDYPEWNIGINISRIIDENIYSSESLYFTYNDKNDMTSLIEYITEKIPDGGFIYTYMEEEDYLLLVEEMKNSGLDYPKYHSTTLLGNVIKEARSHPELFKSTVFFGPYLPFIESKANRDFMLFCKLSGVNINKFSYRELLNFVNLYELFVVYPEIDNTPYKYNKRLYFPVFIYTQRFTLPEGNQIVEFNNYLSKTLYLYEYSEETGSFEHVLGNERTYVQDGFPFQTFHCNVTSHQILTERNVVNIGIVKPDESEINPYLYSFMLVNHMNGYGTLNNTFLRPYIIDFHDKESFEEALEYLNSKNVSHIFCSKSLNIEAQDSLKKYNNMQLWLTSYDSDYRCDNQIFVLSPSFTHQLLPIIYYFRFIKTINYIYVAQEGDAYGEFTGKIVTRLEDISNFIFKGSLYLSFERDEEAVYNELIEYISSHLKANGLIICTVKPHIVKRFKKYLENVPLFFKNTIHFVFIYADVFSDLNVAGLNYYATTHFSYHMNSSEAKLFVDFLSSHFSRDVPHELIEITNTAFLVFCYLFRRLGTADAAVMREHISDYHYDTPHGFSTVGTDNHMSYGFILIRPTNNFEHEILFNMKGPFSSQLQLFFPEIACAVRKKMVNILYLRCLDDIIYSFHDPYPVLSLALKRLNDYFENTEYGFTLKVYEFCNIDDAEVLNKYIDDNNITIVLFGDCHGCKLRLEDFHYNHKYLVFAFGRQLAQFAHEDLFYFGIASLSTIIPNIPFIDKLIRFSPLAILYQNSYISINRAKYYKQELTRFGFNVVGMFGFDVSKSNTTALLKHIGSYFIGTINLLNLVIAPSTNKIVDAANELGYHDLNVYVASDIYYQSLTTKNITGIHIYQSDSYYSGKEAAREDSLFNYVRDYLNYHPGYYDGFIVSGLNSLSFMTMIINQTQSIDVNDWKNILIDMEVDCPQGILKMQNNHQLTNYFYITTLEYDSKVGENVVKLLYSTKNPLYMYPYTPYDYYVADFSDRDRGAKSYDSPKEMAIIFPISGKKAKYNYDPLYIVVGTIMDFNYKLNDEKSGKRIIYHIYDTESESKPWNEVEEEIRNNKNITFIIGGEYVRSKKHFKPSNKQVFFSIGNTPAEECNKNIITFGTTPNQIFNGLNNWLGNNGYASMFIFYNPEYPFNIYKDILIDTMSEMFSINTTQIIKKTTELRKYMYKIPKFIPIILLCDASDAYTFISILRLINFEFEKRNPIITLMIDVFYESNIDLNGLYVLTPYCDCIELFDEYKSASFQYATLDHGSAYGFFSFLAMKTLVVSAYDFYKNNLNDIDDFLNYLYRIKLMSYSVHTSNYISNYFFIQQYTENNVYKPISRINSLISPEPYNFYYNDKKTYICDFTSVGDHHFLAAKYLLLIHRSRSSYDFGLQETVGMAVNEINDNNNFDFVLSILIANIDNDDEDTCTNTIQQYYKNEDIIFYMLSGSDECREKIIPYIESADRLLFYLNPDDGEECKKNVFYLHYCPSQYVNYIAARWHLYYHNHTYYFIVKDNNMHYKLLYTYLEERGMNVKSIDPVEDNKIDEQIQWFIDNYNNPFFIITDYHDSNLGNLTFKLRSYQMKHPDFRYAIFTTTPLYRQLAVYNVTNIYYVGSMAIETEEFNNFLVKFNRVVTQQSYITNLATVTYSGLMLIAKALNRIEDYGITEFGSALYGLNYNGPDGNVTVDVNNHLIKTINIFKINDDYSLSIVEKIVNSVANIFMDKGKYYFGNHFCNWKSFPENGDEIESPLYPLGVVMFEYGKSQFKNRMLYESLTLLRNYNIYIDKINTPFFQYYRIGSGKNENELYANIKSFMEVYKNVSIIIGGLLPSDREDIYRAINNTDIILFYTGFSEGNNCYRNVITAGPLLQTYEYVLVDQGLYYMSSLIVLYDKSDLSLTARNEIALLCSRLKFNYLRDFLINTDSEATALESLSEAWKTIRIICNDLDCTVLKLINDYTIQFVDFFYKQKILAPKYLFYYYDFFPELELLSDFKFYNDITNFYFITTYPYDTSNIVTEIRENIVILEKFFKYSLPFVNTKSTIVNSASMAIELITVTLRKHLSLSDEDIFTLLHDVSYMAIGEAVSYDNNYISSHVYIMYIDRGNLKTLYYTKMMIDPNPYLYEYPGNFGVICRWVGDNTGNRIQRKYIMITIVRESNDVLLYMSRIYTILLTKFIDSQNKYDPVLGDNLLVPYIVSFSNKMKNDDIEYGFNNKYVRAIFGCFTNECSSVVISLAKKYGKLFFYGGINDDSIDNSNTIKLSSLPIPSTKIGVDYFSSLKVVNVLILYPNNTVGYNLEKETEQVIRQNFTVINKLFVSVDDLKVILDIQDCIYKYGHILIFNYLYGGYLKFVSKYINGINFPFINLLFYYTPDIFSNDEKKEFVGHYIISSSSIPDSNNFHYNGLNRFISSIVDTVVTQYMENDYIGLKLFVLAYNYGIEYQGSYRFLSDDLLRASLLRVSYSIPGETIKVNNNLFAYRKSYILQIRDDNTFQHIAPQITISQNTSVTNLVDLNYGPKDVSLGFSKSAIAVISILLVIVSLVDIGAIVFVYYYRNFYIIQFSSFVFLRIYFVSMFIPLISVIFIMIEPKNRVICSCRVWFVTLGICLILSILFTKAWRIQKLFHNRALKKIIITNRDLAILILFIVGIQVLFLALWEIVDPPRVEILRVETPNIFENNFYYQCSTSTGFAVVDILFLFCFLMWGLLISWASRNIQPEFNESKSLALTIGIIFFISFIVIPIDFLLSNEPDATLTIRGISILLGCLAIIITQLGPKIIAIRKEKMEGLDENGNSIEMAGENKNNEENIVRQFNAFMNMENIHPRREAGVNDDSGSSGSHPKRESDVVFINRRSLRLMNYNRNSSININQYGKLDMSVRKTPSQVLLNYDNLPKQSPPPGPESDSDSNPATPVGAASISIHRSSLLTPDKYPVLRFLPSTTDIHKKVNIGNYNYDDVDLDDDDDEPI